MVIYAIAWKAVVPFVYKRIGVELRILRYTLCLWKVGFLV